MVKLKEIKVETVDSFINDLWSTETFKNLHKNNLYFKSLVEKIKIAPIFFYTPNNDKQKNHLTSFFRVLSHRSYDNKYIQDLYYFHELCHLAQYKPEVGISYDDWAKKLNDNELYSSVMSEVLIYFFDKNLHKKTFNPLWANIFIHDIFNDFNKVQNEFGIFYDKNNSKDIEWNNKLESGEIDLFSTKEESWSSNMNYVFSRRHKLRYELNVDEILESERIIIEYNKSREKWLMRWKNNYQKIDIAISDLIKTKNSEKFLKIIMENTNEYGIMFPIDSLPTIKPKI